MSKNFFVGMMFFLGIILLGGISYTSANNSFFLRYCEDSDNPKASSESKVYFINPGEEKELCFYFYTLGSQPIELRYYFTDITRDSQGNKACATEESSKNFYTYFTYTGSRIVTITPNNPVMIKEKVVIPVGMSGEINGCIAYNLSKPVNNDTKGNNIFSVFVRKVGFLTFFVGGNDTIKNEIQILESTGGVYVTNSQIKAYVTEEDGLIVGYKILNNGNITQNINISGTVYNILGFEKKFESANIQLQPGEIKDVEIKVGVLPFYKGFFTIKTKIQHTPVFAFDASNIDDKYKEPKLKKIEGTIFVFSWISLVVLLLILVLMINIVIKVINTIKKIYHRKTSGTNIGS